MTEPTPEAFERIAAQLRIEKTMINVSGVEEEPLWINPYVVDAVGIHAKGAMVVLNSGMQLVAKGKDANEVAQLVCEGIMNQEDELDGYSEGRS